MKKPLTKKQFQDALRKGHGRALLHVRKFGAAGLKSAILHACEHCLVYDTQIEGTRGGWLYEIVVSAGLAEAVKPRVLAALRRASPSEHWCDVDQLNILACCLVHKGDPNDAARKAIYEKFDRGEHGDYSLGGDQILAMDGLAGLLHIAEMAGGRLGSASEGEDTSGIECNICHLFSDACERFGRKEVLRTLSRASVDRPAIRLFRDTVLETDRFWKKADERNRRNRLKKPKQETVATILNAIETLADPRIHRLMPWGHRAGKRQLKAVYERMLEERRPEQLRRFLQVFHRQPLPRVDERVVEWALASDDTLVRRACIRALGYTPSPRVHQLAHDMLSQTPPRLEAIELLRSNYQPPDAALIESALPHQEADAEKRRFIVSNLIDIANEQRPELANCLLWAYEHGPCSHCRQDVLEHLLAIGKAPMTMLRECLADGNDDVRECAREALKKKKRRRSKT